MITEKERAIFKEAMAKVSPLGEQNSKSQKQYQVQNKGIARMDSEPVIDKHLTGSQIISYCQAGYRNTKAYHQLKNGRISADTSLDLHGYTLTEANQQLLNLLNQSRNNCLHIIHGKALKDNYAVIKSLVAQVLSKHKRVLAYHSCPAQYGGSGAVFVLLEG